MACELFQNSWKKKSVIQENKLTKVLTGQPVLQRRVAQFEALSQTLAPRQRAAATQPARLISLHHMLSSKSLSSQFASRLSNDARC